MVAMERGKQEEIELTVAVGEQNVIIGGLLVAVEGNSLLAGKGNCRINLPVANITTVAKTGLNLIVFTNDPHRPMPEADWEGEE